MLYERYESLTLSNSWWKYERKVVQQVDVIKRALRKTNVAFCSRINLRKLCTGLIFSYADFFVFPVEQKLIL